jgi:integrase
LIAARLEEEAALHKEEAAGLSELRRRGLSNPQAESLAEHGRTLLGAHLDDYRVMLEGKTNTAKYVSYTVESCKELLADCGFTTPLDVDAVRVADWIKKAQAGELPKRAGEEERPKLSLQSINHKVASFKGFAAWLFAIGRLRSNPLVLLHKLNADLARTRKRRALTDDEIARLLTAAEAGPTIRGVSGPDRAMIYRVAVATGLRVSEIKSLTPQSFAVDDLGKPRVVVEAACSKHRRRDVLPLDADTALAVARFIEGKPAKALLFPRLGEKIVEAMRKDMDAARPWIPHTDGRGRVADFHALRATAITRWVRSGMTPAVAQRLARHSDIRLTMQTYTDVTDGDMRAALAKLPKLPTTAPPAAEGQPERATGTA